MGEGLGCDGELVVSPVEASLRGEHVCAPELDSDHTLLSLCASVFSFCPSRLNPALIILDLLCCGKKHTKNPRALVHRRTSGVCTAQVDGAQVGVLSYPEASPWQYRNIREIRLPPLSQ